MKKAFITVFLAFVVAIIFYGIRYFQSPVGTVEANLVQYERTVDAQAFFVRDEVVYTSDMFGTVYNHYAEGARVKKGALVSTVYSGTVSDETMQELKTIDKKIENARKSGSAEMSTDTSTVSEESLIENYKSEIIEAGEIQDVRTVNSYKELINDIRAGNSGKSTAQLISELEYQKQLVENRIGVAKSDIYSDFSGIFTTVLDGLENYITPDKAAQMTVADFNAIRVNNSEAVGSVVNAGASICKISNNHEWYVLVLVDAEKVKDYNVGDSLEMRFDSIPGEQIECKILNKSEEQNGQVLLFLVSYHYLEGAYSFRQSDASLVLESYQGYKVPVHALRSENNVSGIMAEKDNNRKFYPCKVLYTDTDEGFVIVNDADQQNTLMGIERIVVGER